MQVFLRDEYRGPSAVSVRVDCFGPSGTPSLAVDQDRYSPEAFLLNATAQPEYKCTSYQVAVTSAAGAAPAAASEKAVESIAVSVHYSGPAKADKQLSNPAVFVFNPVHGNWTEAKPYAPREQEPQRVYATLSEHHQRIIGGVIALPDPLQGEPARAQPSSLSQPLEQINPTDGYLSVEGIEPDHKGAYSVNLPLLLRPSRGPGPSFAISYNSQGAADVLGRGWGLTIGAIDVRGPSPLYHPAYETEDYILDGMELIALDGKGRDIPPLYKGGPIIPRIKGERVFRLRNHSSGIIVRRHGDGPDNYFWSVWNPSSHVTRLYGGQLKHPDKSSALSLDRNGLLDGMAVFGGDARRVTGQWGLTQEYDSQTARNGARYVYVQAGEAKRSCTSSWGGQCSSALRLDHVEYNLAFGLPPGAIDASGVTKVRFNWREREKQRFNSDGRLGFFRAQEYWLDELVVSYHSRNAWLVASATEDGLSDGEVLFARHRFRLGGSDDACMNYDTVLKSYEVEANSRYDVTPVSDPSDGALLQKQVFHFDYEGERSHQNGACVRQWKAPVDYNGSGSLGTLPKEAPQGGISSPADLLKDLGFGLLAGQSLLGTGATEEAGGSLYVGVGPPGNPSSKELTGGVKGGVNFTKSEANSTLVDVTGDGIDDIVYRDGKVLRYCGGQRNSDVVAEAPGAGAPSLAKAAAFPGGITYPIDRCGEIKDISDLSVSSTSTRSTGVEGYGVFGAFAGIGYNRSNNDTYVYFTERDGDGLIDLAAYGQILYGQGETMEGGKRVVHFVPNSALTPPLPGSPEKIATIRERTPHLPLDLRRTIGDIEAKLEDASRRLAALAYSQTTLAWEAPLDGTITLAGLFERGSSPSDDDGALRGFDPTDFENLNPEVEKFQKYITEKYDCRFWPEQHHCHQEISDPFGAHYAAVKRQIRFPHTPKARVQLSLFKRATNVVLPCAWVEIGKPTDDLKFADDCRQLETSPGQEMRVETGDVLYITYSVHPHLAAWMKPKARIAYSHVDYDWVFNAAKEQDPAKAKDSAKMLGKLKCKWKDLIAAGEPDDCLLSRQNRYVFDLEEGTIASAPSVTVELPAGSNRVFGGRFQLPSDISRDYHVYFDVHAAPKSLTAKEFGSLPASALPRLFRQEVPEICAAREGICTVEIKPECSDAKEKCDAFSAVDADEYVLASRLTIEHRVDGTAFPVRNLTSRLSNLKWLVPPHVASIFKERRETEGPAGRQYEPAHFDQKVLVYLPIGAGEPDIEYTRVIDGRFDNPDVNLNEGEPYEPQRIRFATMIAYEAANVDLARYRQTLALCYFADEIVNFLKTRYSSHGQPYAEDYSAYWTKQIETYRAGKTEDAKRCDIAKARFESTEFTNDHKPEHESGDGLRLPTLLRGLPYAEQISSAETLLERVLRKLELGIDALTDDPRLTRRGYRLPVKANPLDCDDLAQGKRPLPGPVHSVDDQGKCAYRILTNFAMQDFDEATEWNFKESKLIRQMMASFAGSSKAAFEIELTATVNGTPLPFHELSGRETGNLKCDFADAAKSCIGTYGTIGPDAYFHPKQSGQKGGTPPPPPVAPTPSTDVSGPEESVSDGGPHGDVFQRITTNKRTGRAVAFSNSIMDDQVTAVCPQAYPKYNDRADMEAKQDCPLPANGGPPLKYAGKETYAIPYTILENNRFVGRNRVFEFKANPLDVVEFHFRLSPVVNELIDAAPVAPKSLKGHFSVLDGKTAANPPYAIAAGRHLIPRSPSHILPGGPDLSCARLPSRAGRVPATCRPWTKLAWTEMFLGAQYRTYSDAQFIGVTKDSWVDFSIKRRREILRLHPEIEAAADKYSLEISAIEDPKGAPGKEGDVPRFVAPLASELLVADRKVQPAVVVAARLAVVAANGWGRWETYWVTGSALAAPMMAWMQPVWWEIGVLHSSVAEWLFDSAEVLLPTWSAAAETVKPLGAQLAFFTRDPTTAKTGGDWSFFAGKATKDGAVRLPPGFGDLRFSARYAPPIPAEEDRDYEQASKACGGLYNPDYRGCESHLGPTGDRAVALSDFQYFGLAHRFVGPVPKSAADKVFDGHVFIPFGTCSAETPKGVASCWKGADDTVLVEAAISPSATVLHSASALLGLERPPLAEFLFDFASYKKIACLDPTPPDACSAEPAEESGPAPGEESDAAPGEEPGVVPGEELADADKDLTYPNRPVPPGPDRTVPVFAPVQSSRSQSVSRNAGISLVNASSSDTSKRLTSLFQDVNGDGYPERIVAGVAELSSPVGLPRRDWWRYFREEENTPPLTFGLNAASYDQGAQSNSSGAGVGLSPSTFAVFEQNGSYTEKTGSPDPKVDPSFDLSLESGYDSAFSELRDFNGDGLADKILGSAVGAALKLHLNAGSSLRFESSGSMAVAGHPTYGQPFNTNNSAGFGVRLGFSWGAGSFGAGAGLSHQDTGSTAALMDFTGDGRPDIVLPSGGTLVVFPNLGNGYGPAKVHSLPGWKAKQTALSETTLLDAGALYTGGISTPVFRIVFNPGVKWTKNQTRELLNIRDINADGAPDVATVTGRFQGGLDSLAASNLKTAVHYNPEAKYHLLAGVQNPAGSRFVLRHGLYGNSGPEHGHAVWALTSVARYDGFEPRLEGKKVHPLPADGHDVSLSAYDYAKGYYNRAERQFYGFSRRTSTVYGCDLDPKAKSAKECADLLQPVAEIGPTVLASLDKLQLVRQQFSNQDFLSQGMVLSELMAGTESGTGAKDKVKPKAVSKSDFRYSIDRPFTLIFSEGCKAPEDFGDYWGATTFSAATSVLTCASDGSAIGSNGVVFGKEGICEGDVAGCAETLRKDLIAAGFDREQSAFWGQQSGALRQRLIALDTFGNQNLACTAEKASKKVEPVPSEEASKASVNCSVESKDTAPPVPGAVKPIPPVPSLRSAVVFNHDQWGQVLDFNSIGEASSAWLPAAKASAHAIIAYATRQGLGAKGEAAEAGYPLLGLAENIRIFEGPWKGAKDAGTVPLRAREAVYSIDGRGNTTDICLYPGGVGFAFTPGMCAAFSNNMHTALGDHYSTLQSALRSAYAETDGLPKGDSDFTAVIHHRLASYDLSGNLTHVVSPVSHSREWIERRFDYSGDPFRRSATSSELTRCVEDIAGAGIDSLKLRKPEMSRCTFGLAALPEPVRRQSVTHASYSRIDGHFGTVAEVEDINANALLHDFDRWGRLRLIARAWGKEPRENRTFQALLDLAGKKADSKRPGESKPEAKAPKTETVEPTTERSWNILAVADYRDASAGVLRSNLRRFESADSYAGLLGGGNSTRETAIFSDGLGRPVQSLREADVCVEALPGLVKNGKNTTAAAGLAERCTAVATGAVTPSIAIDALGRELGSFEAYPIDAKVSKRDGSKLRFLGLVAAPADWVPAPVSETTYDGAGRPLLVESRLAKMAGKGVRGTAQYRYSITPENGSRLARFEALSLSPRCTASAAWSDARGLTRTVFEHQDRFFHADGTPPRSPGAEPVSYERKYDYTLGFCSAIGDIAREWADLAKMSEANDDAQPSRVSYVYDALQQLTQVNSPLATSVRAKTNVRFDLLGRTVELNEPNAGCTRYVYDGLHSLISETGFRYETSAQSSCGTSSKVRNEKSYGYSGGRLVEMAYRSLEEQAGVDDDLDTVRFYYDRYPYAGRRGELLEALRFVDNDLANQRFIDATGLECDNCTGQVTLLTDRAGARSFSYNELGLVRRELRSIAAPLTRVTRSAGESETDIPEVAFYEQENSYTAFGDPVQEEFSESAPSNPSPECVKEGIETCLARFSVGRKYAPDGAVAELHFNGKPLIRAAQDALGRPAMRWTADGTASGYSYDKQDLRLNEMATLTAANQAVQGNGYQYDGGGNIVGYANQVLATEKYASGFAFTYDAVNRLKGFRADITKGKQHITSRGSYEYDAGHRFAGRGLGITDEAGKTFQRDWVYTYPADPDRPAHAPGAIDFTVDNKLATTTFAYDDVGRMIRVNSGDGATPLISSRALSWDGAGRLARVRGVATAKEEAANDNAGLLREDYLYDSGGNRTLKIHRPRDKNATPREGEAATIYMTPFYARPHNGRGSVQLSQGNLPTASLTPPADDSSDPLTTYLFADLPVGSMTASVTAFGEATDAGATNIARREYEPYGLELTADYLADTRREGVSPMSVFHGKELDRVTAFSSFGARSYSRDLGLWLSADPMTLSYLRGVPSGGVFNLRNLAQYAYAYGNPSMFVDKDGNNPGLCYSGVSQVSPCANFTTGNPVFDNTVLAVSNQVNNIWASYVNLFWDTFIVAGDIVEPYQDELNALAAIPEVGPALRSSGLGLRAFSISARARLAGRIPPVLRAGIQGSIRSIDELSRSAAALDQGELTSAGRALQKHGARPGSAFPSVKGGPRAINAQGQQIVDEILGNPGSKSFSRHHARFGNVSEIRAPDGRGIRYSADGKFIGFLEPNK